MLRSLSDRSVFTGRWILFIVLVALSISYLPTRTITPYNPLAKDSECKDPKYTLGRVPKEALHDDQQHTSWCPEAICHNSDICHPCQRRFLILIATGRSASTTLTYMLNALPGIRMSGENNDTLKAIRNMIENIRTMEAFVGRANQTAAWGHNPVPKGAFGCVAQKMIETINPPPVDENGNVLDDDSDTIVGFKTIRFLRGLGEDDTEAMVQWVKNHFPCARVIVNIRSNVEQQAKSQKVLGKNVRQDAEQLRHTNDRMNQVAQFFGEQAFLLDSSVWLNDTSHLNQAVRWLGFHESCFFQELLELNTNYFRHGNKTNLQVNPKCHFVGS
jgi:hypothetical protein